MKYRCPYSGESYTLDSLNFSSVLNKVSGFITSPHPIMQLDKHNIKLIASAVIAHKSTPDAHSVNLIHAAMLYHTGLVDFHCAAAPDMSTALLNISKLSGLITFLDGLSSTINRARFPRYAISVNSRDCSNIPNWIKEIETIVSSYRISSEPARHADVDTLVERILNNNFTTPESKAAGYASYIRKLINSHRKYSNMLVPNKLRNDKRSYLADYVTDVIKADRFKVTLLGTDEIEKIENILIEITPIGTAIGSAILTHVRKLKSSIDMEAMHAAVIMQWDRKRETALSSADVEIDIIADDITDDSIIIPFPKPDIITEPVKPIEPTKPIKSTFASDKLYYAAHAKFIMESASYKHAMLAYEIKLARYQEHINNSGATNQSDES